MASSKRLCHSLAQNVVVSPSRAHHPCSSIHQQYGSSVRSFSSIPALRHPTRIPSIGDITPDGGAAFDSRQNEFRQGLVAAQKAKEQQESQLRSSSSSSQSPSLFAGPAVASTGAATAGGFNSSGVSASSAPATAGSSSGSVAGADASSSSASVQSESNAERASLFAKSLSSLSSGEESEQAAAGQESGGKKKSGPLASLIYGTTEGRNMEKELERSFSQVLARGKYVHSIVFHKVKPDRVDEYVELVGSWYPRLAKMQEHGVNLVGSWRTEVGDCDTFGKYKSDHHDDSSIPVSIADIKLLAVHIWEYRRYKGYHASQHSIRNHPELPAFDAKLKTLITSKRTSLMQEFSFWPTTPPRQLGGLFELRSYTLHPGNLLEWETHWRRGLRARREVMEGVGAWFVQIGDLNTVHHLWQFANLEERKVRREESWSIEGWGDTVHKTVPLIQTMKSRILIPLPWSPVA